MTKQLKCVTILLVAGLAPSALADTLVLEDGESLSGRLVRIESGVLIFRTSLSGQMLVPMDTVQTLTTAENLVVTMQDEAVRYGRLAARDNTAQLLPIDGGPPEAIALAEIAEAARIPSSQAGSGEEEEEDWRISVGGGVLHRSGNRDTTDAYARLEIEHQSEKVALKAEGILERADPDDFPSFGRGRAELQGLRSESARPYGAVAAERDTSAALALRAAAHLGLAWPLVDNGLTRLDGITGLGVEYEEWNLSLLEDGRLFASSRSSDTELTAQLGLHYSRALFGKGAVTSELAFIPDLTSLGNLRARSETAVTYLLTRRLRLRFDFIINYNNDPGFDRLDEWDGAVGAGIQVDF